MMERYLGDWKSWQGDSCKECGKMHPSWAHNPITAVSAAKIKMTKQMANTAYVLSHPAKYDAGRRERSIALLELAIAEFDLITAEREQTAAERQAIKRIKRELELAIAQRTRINRTEGATPEEQALITSLEEIREKMLSES